MLFPFLKKNYNEPNENVIFFLKFIFAETKALAEKQAKEAMAMAQAKCSLQ